MKHSYAEQQPDVDELITTNSELVRKIAWQIHGRARHITEIEDIIQIGYTGLIVAAQNYTPLDGATFASYASIRIRGAIVDYLRKSSNLCRTTIQVKKKYNSAVEKLERQLLRQPSREGLALPGFGPLHVQFLKGIVLQERMPQELNHKLLGPRPRRRD